MLKRLASVVAATAIIAGVACAQGETPVLDQGTFYIGGGARWDSLNNNNLYAVSANLGYLFTKNIAGEAAWTYTDDGEGDWSTILNVKAKWLFTGTGNSLVPYLSVGGVYGKYSGGDNDTEIVYGGGVDYFLKPHVSVYADVETYKMDFLTDWTWQTTLGLRYWFK
jgi:hypothetical protein